MTEPTPRYEWERLVRRIKMPASNKLLALVLATYADPDGSRVRPGNEVLAAVTGQSERTVKRNLASLRELGLLAIARRGGGRAGVGKTTEYQLTIPMDLLERAELLAPGDRRLKAVDSPVDNPNEGTPVAPESVSATTNEGPPVTPENVIEGPFRANEGPPGWPTTKTQLPTTKETNPVVATQGESRPRARGQPKTHRPLRSVS